MAADRSKDVALPQVDLLLASWRIRYHLLQFLVPLAKGFVSSRIPTYQLVKHTLVQRPLVCPAVPQLLVVVLQALPMAAELLQAVVVDVLDPTPLISAVSNLTLCIANVHARGATSDLATLLHALKLSPAVRLSLAHHVVVIVSLASCADKERSAQKGSGGGAELLDLGDVIGQRSGVDEGLRLETGGQLAQTSPIHKLFTCIPGLASRHDGSLGPMAAARGAWSFGRASK